jgi:hypothetical protein
VSGRVAGCFHAPLFSRFRLALAANLTLLGFLLGFFAPPPLLLNPFAPAPRLPAQPNAA